MSYLALYRKYRPQKFEDVVGQEYVIKVLKNSIINDKVSHAYLFFGPRGTGKTTIAKLIAKVINCENRKNFETCEKCSSCLAFNEKNDPDIIEMDAASNNGVDEIREIRDKIVLIPSISKYKIYIIDEVHMLSPGAFNALLKTLEEPPEHAIFILATTEFYKVPETIVSRCQCFNFEKISEDDIIKKLTEIIKKEKIKISDNTISLIAKFSNGGLRDAISLLDKLCSYSNNINEEDFYNLRGIVNEKELEDIFNFLINKDINNIIDKVEDLNRKGKNLLLLSQELMNFSKNILIETSKKEMDYDKNTMFLIIDTLNKCVVEMKSSSNPLAIFEVYLLKIINSISKEETKEEEKLTIAKPDNNSKEQLKEESFVIAKKIFMQDSYSEEKILKQEEKVSNLINEIEENRKIRINNAFATANKNYKEELQNKWSNLNEYIYNKEFSNVVSFLLDGKICVVGEENIIISVNYSSVLENALINIEKIEKLLNLISEKNYRIAFILDSEWEELKKKYKKDREAGKKYLYKEEKKIKCDIINENQTKQSEIIKEAVDLFGKDIIEIK